LSQEYHLASASDLGTLVGFSRELGKFLRAARMTIGMGSMSFSNMPSIVGKGYRERGAGLACKRKRPPELLGQHGDELQPEGFRVAEIEVRREANPGIAHTQDDLPALGSKCDVDVTRATVGEGVFQGIGEEFIENEAAGAVSTSKVSSSSSVCKWMCEGPSA
jgi:hypothetical protein